MAIPDSDVIDHLLGGTVEELDHPEPVLALADQIYDDLGLYLSDHLPSGRDWTFYPQGSARIGTGTRPHGRDEWDIDAVAEVDAEKDSIGKAELKDVLGSALQGYVIARADDHKLRPTRVEPGRRCWTLCYDYPFHLDVLPGVPNRQGPLHGIWIADRDMQRWQPSNPKGYAQWFERRMEREFLERRTEMAKAAKVSVEDIPAWRVKTTLQREVQVLKVHRDSYFADCLDNRPPSCVVTTLAALAYRGETSLTEALLGAATDLARHISIEGDTWVVENPAQPGDNLADRWSANPTARASFRPWIDDLRRTLDSAQSSRAGMPALVDTLSNRFDRQLLTKAMRKYAERKTTHRDTGRLVVTGAGTLATAAKGTSVRPHTFHG